MGEWVSVMRKIWFLIFIFSINAWGADNGILRSLLALAPATPICTGLDPGWTPQYASILGYWKLDGVGSITHGDTSPATVGINGFFKNTDGLDLTYISSGVHASAVEFDTVDAYMYLNASHTYEPTQLTIAAWVRLSTAAASSSHIMSKCDSSGFCFYVNSSNGLAFQARVSGAYRSVNSGAHKLVVGKWHHVAVTYDGADFKIYLDGQLRGTTTYAGTIDYPTYNSLCIGKDASPTNTGCNAANSTKFPGAIDDIAIWSVGLTGADIATLYRRTGCTN